MELKIPKVPVWITAKDEPVEVALVEVLFCSVIFAKLVAAVKEFVPAKVLLFAKSVVEAPVMAVLQPNVPLL